MTAIEDDAELVVCVGPDFEEAVGSLQEEYKDVYFLLLGGVPKDAEGEEIEIAANVHCIIYKEEEAGYLAGYMSVLEGYRKFGFIGGEDRSAVEKYGCGYLQGIDAAAQGLAIIDAGHYGVEKMFIPYMGTYLREHAPGLQVIEQEVREPFLYC